MSRPVGALDAPEPELQAPGVHLARRTLLWLPVAATASGALARLPLAQEAAPVPADPFAPLGMEDFGARWQALGQALLGARPEHDEAYATQLAALAARLRLAEVPTVEKPRRSPGLAAGPAWFLAPCALIEFRMEPGARIRLHNHPPQIVLTLCLEGEVAYRHLELEGEEIPCTELGVDFLVRETRSGFLRPGTSTRLTRTRDGIHGFVAGKQGARLVDLTVSTTADIETFSYLELGATPVEPERRVFEARWTGKS